MTFSSLTFTTLFFTVVLILYFICTDLRWRNGVLLVASLIFYSWGESVWVLAMIGSTAINYSGYSNIVIGMGRIFGLTYKENFNYPYISKSASEFWRRWHISLGIFFRDYVYIPLGDNSFGQCDVQELAPKAAKD